MLCAVVAIDLGLGAGFAFGEDPTDSIIKDLHGVSGMVFKLASRVTCTASGESPGSGSDACIRPREGTAVRRIAMRIGNAISRTISEVLACETI